MDLTKNKEQFESIAGQIKRRGIPELLEFLENSDFYKAPASTKYHMSCEGGLLNHSLNVYDCLLRKKEDGLWKEILKDTSEESIAVMALFHDICKVNCYKSISKNIKNYDPDAVAAANPYSVKSDSSGRYVWDTAMAYEFDDEEPLGHGEKSVIMLQNFIDLSFEEMYAIRWHMGFADDSSKWSAIGKAMEKYPSVLALIEADMEASKLIEGEKDNKFELV